MCCFVAVLVIKKLELRGPSVLCILYFPVRATQMISMHGNLPLHHYANLAGYTKIFILFCAPPSKSDE